MNNIRFDFPDAPLKSGAATELLFPLGLRTFYEAVHWVWKLPYGRTTDRSNYLLVPREQKGSCSGKHAFLAKLAEETGIPLYLNVGIFMMNGKNTPAIKKILEHTTLDSIPEAHCFLRFQDSKYDFTFYNENLAPAPKMSFLMEEKISPDQIGDYKVQLHRHWVKNWITASKQQLSFDKIWSIREECIQALS